MSLMVCQDVWSTAHRCMPSQAVMRRTRRYHPSTHLATAPPPLPPSLPFFLFLPAVEGAADELGEDVAEEASKLGEVVKLSVFSKHSDGPIVIRFKSAGAAVEAISLFNGRFFGGRKITCEFWDGQTDFR